MRPHTKNGRRDETTRQPESYHAYARTFYLYRTHHFTVMVRLKMMWSEERPI